MNPFMKWVLSIQNILYVTAVNTDIIYDWTGAFNTENESKHHFLSRMWTELPGEWAVAGIGCWIQNKTIAPWIVVTYMLAVWGHCGESFWWMGSDW